MDDEVLLMNNIPHMHEILQVESSKEDMGQGLSVRVFASLTESYHKVVYIYGKINQGDIKDMMHVMGIPIFEKEHFLSFKGGNRFSDSEMKTILGVVDEIKDNLKNQRNSKKFK